MERRARKTRRALSVFAAVLAMALVSLPAPAEIRPRIDFQQLSIAYCMEYLREHGAYFGDPNNIYWHPHNIAWLCEVNDGWQEVPPKAIQCFSRNLDAGMNWSRSIVACRKAAGKPA